MAVAYEREDGRSADASAWRGARTGTASSRSRSRPWARTRRASALAACAAAALVALGCEQEPARAPSAGTPGDAVQTVLRMNLRESEAGKLRWVLEADSAFVYGEEDSTLLRSMRVEFYDPKGESVTSTLESRRGQVDARTRLLIAKDHVVVVSREGHRLETEELRWDPEIGKVVSDRFVRLTKDGSVITGVGIESDPDLGSYSIRSRVKGELREGDPILDELSK
ncbi:MAG: LPS export ABC transporter periplasmic protein LptC [Candidatus Eisenbacteria bacterium]|nr:LPS export ABC transporter periplasmic protein LptC [Candidatus Eisenbacteria bacterium]